MATSFSKSLLHAFVDEFVDKSQTLCLHSFSRSTIAKKVFPGSSPKNAKSRLSACCSPASVRPLDPVDLAAILDACRFLLAEQLQKLGEKHWDQLVDKFERQVRQKLRLNSSSARATIDDFRAERLLDLTAGPQDFGLPDIVNWKEGGFGFAIDLRKAQRRAVRVLEDIVQQIPRLSDYRRRLDLLQIGISASSINHLDSPLHDYAYDLLLKAASYAELTLLAHGYAVSDEIRLRATRTQLHLHTARFFPELDSPANYNRFALGGHKMPLSTWQRLQPYVEDAILVSKRVAALDPNNPNAIIGRSGMLSLKSRILAVAGTAADLREADDFQTQSLIDLDRVSQPYGFAYPIVKDVVQSNFKSAARRCMIAIPILEAGGSPDSAAAFAALCLQLTAINGSATSDSVIRRLAARAIKSPSIVYACSHIFDADKVRELLKATATERNESQVRRIGK